MPAIAITLLFLVAGRRAARSGDLSRLVLVIDVTLTGLILGLLPFVSIYAGEVLGLQATVAITLTTGLLLGYAWGRRQRHDRSFASRFAKPS